MSVDKSLERVNYYPGMLLAVDDFASEQRYFLDKFRRHNRYLHGWGIVRGLTVTVRSGYVVVAPGLAIDCAGNEILLAARSKLALPPGAGALYVALEYVEKLVKPVPALAGSPTAGEAQVFTRIREQCRIHLLETDPNSSHDSIGPGTPGCGLGHLLAIARLEKLSRGWCVTLLGRR